MIRMGVHDRKNTHEGAFAVLTTILKFGVTFITAFLICGTRILIAVFCIFEPQFIVCPVR